MKQDAIIIGGSFAGLAGAMMLARARRPITVIDAGLPRNRFASHSHGFLGHDGRPGSDILADARAQLLAYPTVTFVEGTAVHAGGGIDNFSVELDTGAVLEGRRLLIASGVRDNLPDIPGIAERWGETVLHCPYCHGFEIGGGKIGVIAGSPLSYHQAALVADWGDVTFFTNDMPLEQEALDLLTRRNVRLAPGKVAAISDAGGGGLSVEIENKPGTTVKAIFVATKLDVQNPIVDALRCRLEETPMGTIIETDAMKATSVAGVFAAGDAARAAGNITFAAADGSMAALAIHRSLIF
jgi:thioredoxin reductase